MGQVTRFFDALVGIVSPKAQFERQKYRQILQAVERAETYAAAKTNRSTGTWSPLNSSINDIIAGSGTTVRGRVRQLVRDFPFLARAANALVEHAVGEGILLQALPRDKSGAVNRELAQIIEDEFNAWAESAESADIAGVLSFHEAAQLAKRQDVECGEFLLIHEAAKGFTGKPEYRFRLIEPDWIDSGYEQEKGNVRAKQGVEYDNLTGARTGYWLVDPDTAGSPMRVEAARVLHRFQTLRPGQLRGISPFVTAVIIAHDLDDYMGAEVDAAKLAAKYLAFVRTMDPSLRQGALTTGAGGEKIDDLENAIVEYLGWNETIEIAHNPRPGGNFGPFVRLILCILSISTGVPYEILSGDYSQMNYSSGRMVRNDFARSIRVVAGRHIRHFCQPIYRKWLDLAVLGGKFSLPGYWENPAPYLRAVWQPPGMESIDPLKEANANAIQIQNRLRSPQEIMAARGRNIEDVYREIAEAKALADEMGISWEDVTQAAEVATAELSGRGAVDIADNLAALMDKIDGILSRVA